jgi:hypothetical protein
MNGTGVDGDIMANGDVGANMRGPRLMGDMDARTVLHVRTVAYGDGGNVAADNGIKPYGTLVAKCYITYNSRILAEIAVMAPFGCHTLITLD